MAVQNPFLGIDQGKPRDDDETVLRNLETFKSYCLEKMTEKPTSRSVIWAEFEAEVEAQPSLDDELTPFKNWIVH